MKRNLSLLAMGFVSISILIACGSLLRLSFADEEEHLRIVSAEYTPEGIRILIGYPYGFTNQLDVFTSTNPYELNWVIEETFSVNLSTNRVEWCDVLFAEKEKVFYRIGNAGFDSDEDGLADGQEECVYGTEPDNPDTDDDDVTDGVEVLMGTDPLDDSSFPIDPTDDSDGDGMPDWWENIYFGGITSALSERDEEPDGWTNIQEYLRGGNPTNAWVCDTNNVLELETQTPLRE